MRRGQRARRSEGVLDRGCLQLSKELTVRIEVVRPVSRPTLVQAPKLEDWVGCVSPTGANGLVAAGLYDGSVCVSRQPSTIGQASEPLGGKGEAIERGSSVSSAEHGAPVKGVDMKLCRDDRYLLVSASKDCFLRCWEYGGIGDHPPLCTAVCEGHAAAVDCVSFESGPCEGAVRFASGAWDNTVKLWEIEPCQTVLPSSPATVLPAASMDGHTQAVSCLCWPDGEAIYR